MKTNRHPVSIFWLLTTAFSAIGAISEPVIYGTVTQSNGNSMTGTIRWGDQEHFLSDIFNGEKNEVIGIEHLSEKEKDRLLDQQPGPQVIVGEIQITFKSFFDKELDLPYFNVPFGALDTIEVDNNSEVIIATLHDGSRIKSQATTNDLTDEIYLKTTEGKVSEFDWDEIKSITFSAAPNDASTFDQAIYGTVTSDLGTFKGRIMWDKDERMLSEKLDGHENGVEYNLKFSEINSIERKDNSSLVVLKNGKSLLLNGTNDVNSSNRGLWVDSPMYGRVEINWSQFNKLTIEDVDINWLNFNDYKKINRPLKGTVTKQDDTVLIADEIIFDLNQQSPLERLDVEVNQSNRLIPMHHIKNIHKKNDMSAELTFIDNSTLLAYGSHSVTRDNKGLMIKSNNTYQWVEWHDIKSITFD